MKYENLDLTNEIESKDLRDTFITINAVTTNFNDNVNIGSKKLFQEFEDLRKKFNTPRIEFIVNGSFGDKKLIKMCRSKKKRILKKWKKNSRNYRFVPHSHVFELSTPLYGGFYDYGKFYDYLRLETKTKSYIMHTSIFEKLRYALERDGELGKLDNIDIRYVNL